MLDCRQMLLGDRYRQLQRAYGEAIRRLSRKAPLSSLEADIRDSAEIAQYYDIDAGGGRISVTLKHAAFTEQYPLHPDDFAIKAAHAAEGPSLVPVPLERFEAMGALVPLLAGDRDGAAIAQALGDLPDADSRTWAEDFLRWLEGEGFIERGAARPNFFLRSPERPRVTLVGHTSLLLQSARAAIVTDPIIWHLVGSPAAAFDLPRLPLNAICCTHAHWDHCNLATLLRFDKSIPVIIPRVIGPTAFNPPIAPVLRRFGFQNLREMSPWESIQIGDVEMTLVPFHGEEDEPGAKIDHYTYVFRMPGLTLYGGVDAFRDSHGDMRQILQRVRQEFQPTVAFLPVSRMKYRYAHGGVNAFCRYVDNTMLDGEYQYTAGPEEAAEWVELLGVSTVVPYATFTFSRLAAPAPIVEFAAVLKARGLARALLALRPLDALDLSDLDGSPHALRRRQSLARRLEARALVSRFDTRLARFGAYRVARRTLIGRKAVIPHN